MSEAAGDRRRHLRGSLGAEEPGARGLERIARNPGCSRLRALTHVGITPATAAEKIYGEMVEEGQSPFALATGNRFESYLYENGAQRLLKLCRESGRLLSSETKVVIVPDHAPGTTPADMALRESVTRRALQMKLRGDPQAPNIIIQPRVRVWLGGVGHPIEPDAIIGRDEEPFYRAAEIKSYADRDGKTDKSDLRGGLRQAAVAVVALRQTVVPLGIREPQGFVLPRCDLVLKAPGSFAPRLRSMNILGEVDSIERVISTAPSDLDKVQTILESIAPGATLDDPAVLDRIPNNYEQDCKGHCALHRICKAQAQDEGDAVLLGARQELAAAGSLGRALALLGGARARTLQEAELQRQLQEANDVFDTEVGFGA